VREASEAHALSIKDALARHDSYVFFKTVGAQIETGPTGSNIADIIIALK
jgi:glycerate-2-kinase